jgi:hypothetical protein
MMQPMTPRLCLVVVAGLSSGVTAVNGSRGLSFDSLGFSLGRCRDPRIGDV